VRKVLEYANPALLVMNALLHHIPRFRAALVTILWDLLLNVPFVKLAGTVLMASKVSYVLRAHTPPEAKVNARIVLLVIIAQLPRSN
jgi:hypothetical protein